MVKTVFASVLAAVAVSASAVTVPSWLSSHPAASFYTPKTNASSPFTDTVKEEYLAECSWDVEKETYVWYNGGRNEGTYVYYFTIPVNYGSACTIWSTSTNLYDLSVQSYDPYFEHNYQTEFSQCDYDYDGNLRLTLKASDWYPQDAAEGTVPYLVRVEGEDILTKFTIKWEYAEVKDTSAPLGVWENPEVIRSVPEDRSQTLTRKFPESRWGGLETTYYFQMNLTAGRYYTFRSKSDSVSYPSTVSVLGGDEITKDPTVNPGQPGDFDDAINVYVHETGFYWVQVDAQSKNFTLEYGGRPGLLPAEHSKITTITPLTAGSSVAFVPGHIVKPGSEYRDDVIDECLFSFSALANETLRFATTGAQTNLLMRLYDAGGAVLAETSEKSASDFNALLAHKFSEPGTYYLGVCEKLANDTTDTPTGCSVSLRMEKCDDSGRDAWDHGDDESAGATVLAPILTAQTVAPSKARGCDGQENVGNGPHRLSPTDTFDWFSFAVQTDFTYKVEAVLAQPFALSDWYLAPEFYLQTGSQLMSLTATEQDGVYSVSPTAGGMCLVKYTVRRRLPDGSSVAVTGADSPDYTVYACAYSPDADDYGWITAEAKGPKSGTRVQWRFVGGTWCDNGQWQLNKGSVTLEFSAVPGFRTPDPQTVTVERKGAYRTVTAVYDDEFDPADNVAGQAQPLTLANAPTNVCRTMWANSTPADTADWFKFEAKVGVYYNFKFSEVMPAGEQPVGNVVEPAFFLYSTPEAEEPLCASTNLISFGAPTDGARWLCVKASRKLCCGLKAVVDCSYAFDAWTVETGSIVFEADAVTVDSDAGVAVVNVLRTSSEGSVSVNWGTIAGSAEPDVDYCPASGTLTWPDGDASPKPIRVKLIPNLYSGIGNDRQFSIRLWPAEVAHEGEYPAVIAGTATATVTLTDGAGDRNVGKLSLTGHGFDNAAFADANHPTLTVAPGTRVRLWVGRSDGTNGVVAAQIGYSGACSGTDDVVLTWKNGETAAKCFGLTVSPDAVAGDVVEVRLDNPEGTPLTAFGSRHVRIVVDPTLPAPGPESDEERAASEALALTRFAGRYTVALIPGNQVDLASRQGYLTLTLDSDGAVVVSGILPDGTQIGQTVQVEVVGDTLYPNEVELLVPLSGHGLEGVLRLSMEDDIPVVRTPLDDEDKLLCGKTLVVPVGGLYQADASAQTWYSDRNVWFESSGQRFDVEISGDAFSCPTAVQLSLDKETGVMTVSGGSVVGKGALIMSCDAAGADFGGIAYGYCPTGAWMLGCEQRPSEDPEPWEDGIEVRVTFDGNGNTSGLVLDPIVSTTAGAYEIAAYCSSDFGKVGSTFSGWQMPDGTVIQPGDIFRVRACDMRLTAVWSQPEIAVALGCAEDGILFFNDPAHPWTIHSKPDGSATLMSGELPNRQAEYSTLKGCLTVKVPGTLTFYWDCDLDDETDYNNCSFWVDGVRQTLISGLAKDHEGQWFSLDLPVGVHTLEWKRYKMIGAWDDLGTDLVWLSDVSFGTQVPVRFETGSEGTLPTKDVTMYVGRLFGDLPVPTSEKKDFTGWFLNDVRVSSGTRVPDVDCILVAGWTNRRWRVSFDANGAVNADVATPSTVSNFAGQTMWIPGDNGLLRPGYDFMGWHDGIHDKTWSNEFYTVMETNVVMTAKWNLGDLEPVLKGPGLDCMTLEYEGSDWFPVTVDKVNMLRSGAISAGGSSTVKATMLANGAVSFAWKTSCGSSAQGGCRVVRIRNGIEEELFTISGEMTDLQTREIDDVRINDVIKWTYWRAGGAPAVGSDCAWLERISFGKKVAVTFLAPGGDPSESSLLKFVGSSFEDGETPVPVWSDKVLSGWVDPSGTVVTNGIWTVPDAAVSLTALTTARVFKVTYDLAGGDGLVAPTLGTNRETVVLAGTNGFSRTGYVFSKWLIDSRRYDAEAEYVLPAHDVTAVAEWEVGGLEGFLKGPGLENFAFENGGTPWTPVTVGGVNMLRSGAIGNGGSSVFKATMRSPGTLAFTWKCSCDDAGWGTDVIFAINGEEKARIGGAMSRWEDREFSVMTGDVLTWIFCKDSGAVAIGEDCAWLERVALVKKTELTFVAEGSDRPSTVLVKVAGQLLDELPETPIWKVGKSFDHWEDEFGNVVDTGIWEVPDDSAVITAVTKDKVYYVRFDTDGGTPTTLKDLEGKPGDTVRLYGEADVTKPNLVLSGWSDGKRVYADTYPIPTENPPDVTTLKAVWSRDYAAVLGCKGSGIRFYTQSSPAWIGAVNDTAGAKSEMMMRSGEFKGQGRSTFVAEIPADGTLTFEWRVSCDVISCAWASYAVDDGPELARIGGMGDTSWRTVTLTGLKKGQRITWAYEKTAATWDEGEDRVCLQNFVWTPDKPPAYEFTIGWAANAGVLGATYSIEGGAQDVPAVSGQPIEVPVGKTISVKGLADTNGWYVISGGDGDFSVAGSTTITAEKLDSGSLPQDLTPAKLGLGNGPFATADLNELAKVIGWAESNGKTVADMNVLTFSAAGDPVGADAEAYLLNCAPAAVETAKAAFRFTSFDPADPPTADDFAGAGYNGQVLILKASTLEGGGDWGETTENARFYKAKLVK